MKHSSGKGFVWKFEFCKASHPGWLCIESSIDYIPVCIKVIVSLA